MSLYKGFLSFLTMAAFAGAHSGMNNKSMEASQRDHPRDILVKRGRDCGTFTMYCGGLPTRNGDARGATAPMACA
jgi:hypothetical protein